MPSSRAPDALDRPPSTTFALSWTAKATAGAATALAVGFLIGGAAVGPALSDNSPDNAAALQARFERRTVEPQARHPDPFPYRTPTPDFGTQSAPQMGTYARQQAQRELRGRGVATRSLSAEAADSFGADPPAYSRQPEPPAPRYRAYDRHTGTSY